MDQNKSLKPKAAGLLIVLIGLITVGIGYARYSRIHWLKAQGFKARGTMVAKGYTGQSTIEFATNDGRTYSIQTPSGVAAANGSDITLFYNPNSPTEAIVDSTKIWEFPILAGFIGLMLVIAGILVFFKGKTISNINNSFQ